MHSGGPTLKRRRGSITTKETATELFGYSIHLEGFSVRYKTLE